MEPKEYIERMEEMEGHLHHCCVQILSATEPGSLQNLFAGSALYAAKQSKRIREMYAHKPLDDIDAIGWSTRCLMETKLMLNYIMQKEHDEALESIHKELERDDCEIAFGFYQQIDDEASRNTLKKRIKNLPKTPQVKTLSEKTGFLSDYETHYKFLCKYTHPSMYLLFMNPAEVRSQEAVDLMIERSTEYLEDICHAINYTVDSIA